MKNFLATCCLSFLVSHSALGYQLYTPENRIDPAIKDFTFYISSTFYDFKTDSQQPITSIHIEGVKKALEILSSKAQTAGVNLSFSYGGTFDYNSVGERNRTVAQDDSYHAALFYDFTSNELWGRQFVPSASASGKKSPSSNGKRSGGVIRLNSDFLNFLHPDVNMSSSIVHETMHVFGLDHSTVSSAAMAYTEFWYPTLSADDLLGLQNVFGVGPDTEVTVTARFSGAAAPGVEVVLIDAVSGVSYVAMTNSSGSVTVERVPAGNYLLGIRELTPTGPCFENPTRGFLTTFVSQTGVTNSPSSARVISVQENVPQTFSVDLLVGKKKFDCHFGRATALSASSCGGNKSLNPNGNENCFLHMTNKSVVYPLLAENDVSISHHHTDTDKTSAAHNVMTFQPMGTSSGLVFRDVIGVDTKYGNNSKMELEVKSTASNGTQAALCTDGQEFALVSSFIEVQNFGGGTSNKILMPELATEMQPWAELPRNFGQHLRPGDASPGIGPRPSNVVASPDVSATETPAPTETEQTAPSALQEKKKKKGFLGLCGVIAHSKGSEKVDSFLMLSPLLVLFLSGVFAKLKKMRF